MPYKRCRIFADILFPLPPLSPCSLLIMIMAAPIGDSVPLCQAPMKLLPVDFSE